MCKLRTGNLAGRQGTMPITTRNLDVLTGKPYDGPVEIPGGGLSVGISPKGLITFSIAILQWKACTSKIRRQHVH